MMKEMNRLGGLRMHKITSYDEWVTLLEEQPKLLLFVKINGCSVCDGLLPQVEPLQEQYPDVPFYQVNVSEVQEIAGQFSLFTAPVVLLFLHGKEYARFARFVQRDELMKRLEEVQQWED